MLTRHTLTVLAAKTNYKLYICSLLVLCADVLLYGHESGWVVGVFGLVLLAAMLGCNHHTKRHRTIDITMYAALGLVCALIETPTLLAQCLFGVTIVALALMRTIIPVNDARAIANIIIRYTYSGWIRFYRDMLMISHIKKRKAKRYGNKHAVVRHWLLPIGLSSLFIGLFAYANPVITNWMDRVNWQMFGNYVSFSRIIFWLVVASGCWALLRPKYAPRTPRKIPITHKDTYSLTTLLFNERSIFLSLVSFNGLFFVQNMLDIMFLWSGNTLPHGMNYSSYAHQGAYPLIMTALLAALFVLIALKPQSATEKLPLIRVLVYIWVGQNIFLVLSSIIRLVSYIEEYSLTYLRVVALLWMVLVAIGLGLIIARIYLQKSNLWLININSLSLYATLYLCCFINFGGFIADYNVEHSREITGKGAYLDVQYLVQEIGVDAIPALRWYEQRQPDNHHITQLREGLELRLHYTTHDWRQWTLRDFRLSVAGE